MANTSILTAFERFWQHVVAVVSTKADVDSIPAIDSTLSISGQVADSKAVGDALSNKAPAAYIDANIYIGSWEELDAYIDEVLDGMDVHTEKHISIIPLLDNIGVTAAKLTIFKGMTENNMSDAFATVHFADGYIVHKHGCSEGFDENQNWEYLWADWRWENPPMVAGVEYCTTEQYEGSPVYVQLVNFGALPATDWRGEKVYYNADSGGKIIHQGDIIDIIGRAYISYNTSHAESAGEWNPFPSVTGGTAFLFDMWWDWMNGICVRTQQDLSHMVAYFTVKYTKRKERLVT